MWPGLVKQFFSLIMFSIKFYSEQYLEVIPAVPVNEKPNCFGGFRYFLCGQKKKKHLCSGCHNHYAFRQRHFLVLSTPSQPLYSQYTHWYTFHKLKFLFLIEANSSFSFLKKKSVQVLRLRKGPYKTSTSQRQCLGFYQKKKAKGCYLESYSSTLFLPPVLLTNPHECRKENHFTRRNNNGLIISYTFMSTYYVPPLH